MKRVIMLVILFSVVQQLHADPKPILYGGLELLGAGGVNDSFEKDGRDFTNALNSIGIPASVSVKTSGGGGLRLGLLFPQESGFEFGGNFGFIVGPTVDQKFENGAFSVNGVNFLGTGETKIKTKTHFYRFMAEGAKKASLSKTTFVRLSAGAGVAAGSANQQIETTGNAGTLVSALGVKRDVDESWSGFTWEIAPSLVFARGASEFEIGVRYAQFPTKKESDDMSKIEWTPFGVFANLRF